MHIDILIFLASNSAGAQADFPEALSPTVTNENGPLEATSLWVVVDLFTGRKSSKQAMIVRDKLLKLGVGGTAIILPYSSVSLDNIANLRPAFLALSPNGIPWCKYRGRNGPDLDNFLSALRVIIEKMDVPVIGICGGHQALALAFGGKVGPIKGGEDDCFPYTHKPTEKGRHDIQVIAQDPIFTGMGESINLVENHFDEVKKVPPGFIHLARDGLSLYQIIKHPTKPAYGVQAHTEYFYSGRPDGGTLLRNFIKIVWQHNRIAHKGPVKHPGEAVPDRKNRLGAKES